MGKRQGEREDSERVRKLKERVKAGNLAYFDPLVDSRLAEFDHALAQHYPGFKVPWRQGVSCRACIAVQTWRPAAMIAGTASPWCRCLEAANLPTCSFPLKPRRAIVETPSMWQPRVAGLARNNGMAGVVYAKCHVGCL